MEDRISDKTLMIDDQLGHLNESSASSMGAIALYVNRRIDAALQKSEEWA
jgi:hypothetical protein